MSVQPPNPVEQQIELCGPVLLRYCLKLTGSRWDAEDLVQDTFLKAMPHLARPQMNPHAFLFRIAKNAWIDKCRKRKRANECSLAVEQLGEVEAGDAVDPATILDAMSRLVEVLSPLQRAVLLMCDVLEFTNLEVAKQIGTTEGAVKSLLHRARRNLQHLQTQEEKEHQQAHNATLNSYLEAFRNADAEELVALARHNVIHPVHALNTLFASQQRSDVTHSSPAQTLCCA